MSLTVDCISFDMCRNKFITVSMHPKVGCDISLTITIGRDICQTVIYHKTIMTLASTGRRAICNRGVG